MFRPEAIQAFRIVEFAFDASTGEAQFTYAFDHSVTFVETFQFPIPPDGVKNEEAFTRALHLLGLVAGVSYYKAAVPQTVVIESGPVTQAEVDALTAIYRHGLGEFAYVNRLRIGDRPVIDAEIIETRPIEDIEGGQGVLVAVGGGKDSCVTIETMRAGAQPVTLVSINEMKPILDVMAKAELPSVHVQRRLSPELLRINEEGAYNGHVPVTAVVSFALTALAVLWGYDAVVMSNERSASVGNTTWDGMAVNHQWSKSYEAEVLMADLITSSVAPNVQYFSLLRSMSELEIVRRFARLERYHDVFTSCNRAFRIDETRRGDRWCADCPKCRFVFLALAPFMNPTRLSGIFGVDMLRDPSQADGFDALIGWNALKPFECVGEVEESVAAFKMLSDQIAWRDHELVQRFERSILPEMILPADLTTRPFELSADDRVPETYRGLLNATA